MLCVFTNNIFGTYIDGLIIDDDSLIEVKCPYSAKDYPSCIDAVKDKKVKLSAMQIAHIH